MNEKELKEMLGSELFDRLSQDDKELMLSTAGKFDITMNEKFNKPYGHPPFYVIDKKLGELILHPTEDEGFENMYIRLERVYFGIDADGQLIVLDDCGNWFYAPRRYKYIINKDYRSSFEVKNENNR